MGRIRNATMLRRSVLALALLSLGCGPFNRGARERTMVIFTNDSLEQADVYAVISGIDAVRLGTVQPTRTDTLYVPRSVSDRAGQTSLVARLLARTFQPSTGPLSFDGWDVIRIRLSPDGRTLFVLPAR